MSVLKINRRLDKTPNKIHYHLTLPFELRQKSRLRANLDNGLDVGIVLPHGNTLQNGDILQAEDGTIIELRAAQEAVSTVIRSTPESLIRVCYHLGNRHVPVQIDTNWVRFLEDKVLDDMIETLGFRVKHELATFEPEPGAYHHHG